MLRFSCVLNGSCYFEFELEIDFCRMKAKMKKWIVM